LVKMRKPFALDFSLRLRAVDVCFCDGDGVRILCPLILR
jgi:hypothetical protein